MAGNMHLACCTRGECWLNALQHAACECYPSGTVPMKHEHFAELLCLRVGHILPVMRTRTAMGR
ncbi:hypothetical protein Ahy_B08g093213 isoform B [Arachis hypogaea]|uniref:Uncharacterized protein n=1 Tax=Arachis hypogaea TaxID=3818 RepID=A0A444Y5K1_ARAHY|nr:hypothetical protein Ahy_B08g093213 isoform B [Arachis hypogaea]